MKLYVYVRVSTDQQVESGAGLSAQRDACQQWAEKQGLVIDTVFSEEGVSGSTSLEKRPVLAEVISYLKKGDILLISRRDRLGRDLMHVTMIEAAINRKKAKVISVAEEGASGEDPSSILMKNMLDVLSQYERNTIRARTKAAMQAKKRKNERVGHIPFGFRLSDDGVHLEECPEEISILIQIKELMKQGLSTRKIAVEMNNRQAFNRGMARWNHASIHRVMTRIAA